ncbi:MAG TPA: hypothetical protein VG228_10040 [Solirubrobacteraceae bacterium]|jgi:hypothetical protein|nr:hypothetical protein [Solirubrobacteraceae bacterium]
MASSGDRCANCGAAMAVDQRYCVECGTRRGKPRFAIAGAKSQESSAVSGAQVVSATAGWTRLTAMLAVIAVLLALGVGVLIGNASQSSIKQPVKVELTGGSLSSVAATGGSGGSAGKTTSTRGSGSSATKSCTKGTAGCKNGKQTGNFFGG